MVATLDILKKLFNLKTHANIKLKSFLVSKKNILYLLYFILYPLLFKNCY